MGKVDHTSLHYLWQELWQETPNGIPYVSPRRVYHPLENRMRLPELD